MIRFRQKGDFSKLKSYLEKNRKNRFWIELNRYGQLGVDALKSATPKDSGKTASSWYYTIDISNESMSITWSNKNVNKGVPIAIILQYGHGTRNGGWVEGRDYINPAISPVFDRIAEEIWKEITKV